MLPVKDNTANLRKYASLNRHLKVLNGTIFCSICSIEVLHAQKLHINEHLLSGKHTKK